MNRSNLELRHLRLLLALEDSGSLTRAAERLFLTQSALSQQLKALEDHYGAPLLARKSQPPRFTAAGQRLLQLARETLPAIEAAERDLVRIVQGVTGRLRIAVECHSCYDWLMPAMDGFRPRWPEIEQDLVSGFTPDPVGLLLEDKADLAVHTLPDGRPGVAYHALFDFEMVAVMAPSHALAGQAYISPQDFAGETLLCYPVDEQYLDIFREVLTPLNIRPKAKRTAELTAALVQLAASGRGIAVQPVWSVQPYLERGYVVSRPIGRAGFWQRLYAATIAELAESPWAQDFLALVRTETPKGLPGCRPAV